MNLESGLEALIWRDILEQIRDEPTVIPTTREELANLHVRLCEAYAATAVGRAETEVQRFLEWYRVHEKEIAAVQQRLGAVGADAGE